MLKFIKEKFKEIKAKKNQNKINILILKNNKTFLENLQENELEIFFQNLITHYGEIQINININEENKFTNNEMNNFYNNFFKNYNLININKGEVIISKNYNATDLELDEILKDKIVIGNYGIDYLYIKKNSNNNGVFLQNYNNEEDVNKNNYLYRNIYELFLSKIDYIYIADKDKFFIIDFQKDYKKFKEIYKYPKQ